MDPLSALIGGGFNLAGGLLNQQTQMSTNAQNMLMNTGSWKADQILTESGRLGVSPLALLGNMGTNIPMQPATGVGDALSGMGQNIGRAQLQGAPVDDQMHQLQLEHVALQNEGIRQDMALNAARFAHQAVTQGQPGTVWDLRSQTELPPTQFFGGKGDKYAAVPLFGKMYDPRIGTTVTFPTQEGSTRSFGSLGEPFSRLLGDIGFIHNLWGWITGASRPGQDLPRGPFRSDLPAVRGDIGGKFVDRVPN